MFTSGSLSLMVLFHYFMCNLTSVLIDMHLLNLVLICILFVSPYFNILFNLLLFLIAAATIRFEWYVCWLFH
jgi:hypothetical protein